MRTQYTPKIIFSVFHKANSHTENYNHHWSTLKALEMAGVMTVEAEGKYEGRSELCIVVKDTEDTRKYIKKLCSFYQQECYLAIDNEGSGHLVFTGSGETTSLGRYTISSVKPEGDFTKVGQNYLMFQ